MQVCCPKNPPAHVNRCPKCAHLISLQATAVVDAMEQSRVMLKDNWLKSAGISCGALV